MPTERIERLKARFFETGKSICAERARLATEAYQKFEDDPIEIKRAKTLEYILQNMTIYIKEDELIVGHNASRPGGLPVVPETQWAWVSEQLEHFSTRKIFPVAMSAQDKAVLQEVLPYWADKTVASKGFAGLPQETQQAHKLHPAVITLGPHLKGSSGHITVNYATVLKRGFLDLAWEAGERLEQLDALDPFFREKEDYYRAMKIVCTAAADFGKRYAKLAKEKAAACQDPVRKAELERIAGICDRVPAYPAQDFYEAVQSFWFTHVLIMIETEGNSISPGRMDQYLYPYYQGEKARGTLDDDFVQELLDNLFIRFNEVDRVPNVPVNAQTYTNANSQSEMVVVGGQDEDGNDATNELTYRFIQAQIDTGMPQPAFSVRLHSRTPEKLMRAVVKLAKTGQGKPSMFNDELIIPSLLKDGVSLKDAREYGVIGCVEPAPVGNSFTWCNASMFNLAKCLELAIFNGKDPMSGKVVNHLTYVSEDDAFEDLVDAYKVQVEYYARQMVIMLNNLDKLQGEIMPTPLVSAIMDDCVERGVDVTRGGARYNYVGPQGIGVADVADSLEAIRKTVYEEHSLTLDQIREAMLNDFADESLRQRLLNSCPKYGNDMDEADALAHEIAKHYCDQFKGLKNRRGGIYRPGLYSVAGHVALGNAAGALPSGKRRFESLAHGVSPVYGSATKGLTSIFKSVAKLDVAKATNGTSLNPHVHPSLLQTEEDERKMVELLRRFVDLKGMHLCFNVVSKETLLDAQAHPEQYRSLVVRVSGYCAFFVELSRDIQMDVIRRCGVY